MARAGGAVRGNSLALKVVAETIHTVFADDIAAFNAQASGGTVFGGIRRLLQSQVDRLPSSENELLLYLAVQREPVAFGALAADLGPRLARSIILEGLEDLRRRSLVDRGQTGGALTLPSGRPRVHD